MQKTLYILHLLVEQLSYHNFIMKVLSGVQVLQLILFMEILTLFRDGQILKKTVIQNIHIKKISSVELLVMMYKMQVP